MQEHRKLHPKKSDKTDKRQKTDIRNGHLRFGPLGKSIVQSLPIGVVAFDRDLKIIEANSQAAKLIKLGHYIDKSLAKGTDDKFWPGWTEQLKSVVSTGKTCGFDNVNYTFNGKTKLLRIVCTPLKKTKTKRNPGGTVIIEDITEKVNIQRQLANAERLAAVGKLASKVAHELNNPMDGILRYINLAIRIIEQENLEKPKEYLTQCRQGLMRMVQIVSELLEFSRSTYASLEYVKIEQIIEDAVKTMDMRTGASNVRVLRNYAPGLPQIGNGNLFQVFCNLIKNALDSMPDGGELSISTRLAADDTAVVEFRDTGTGFAAENADAIFEPFFTTKDEGKGTGLGLAICKDIVERYHGRITAENTPQGGSIFTVYLPVARNSEKNS
ncbi:MAG: two-component system sensor histidine kinase NtrB [Planctomycetota bacterium]|jgi:nitrogen fixation/metabolism regulation signal transduction histidine kinase